jgi:catechol 2,3-dioxygenase-like lactoylglutathione lyase family enzyme
MDIRRAMPVLKVDDPAQARRFYEEFLGFRVAMQQDGLMMLASPNVPTTQMILASPSATPFDPSVHKLDVSVEVEDVDAAYADAQARGLEIVYPLTDEPWGIRRFFVRDPAGTTLNVASHIADLPRRP